MNTINYASGHANLRMPFALVDKTRVANNTIYTGGCIELPLRA